MPMNVENCHGRTTSPQLQGCEKEGSKSSFCLSYVQQVDKDMSEVKSDLQPQHKYELFHIYFTRICL